MHFDYDLDIKLNPDKFDTKISVDAERHTITLSEEFVRFLTRIFSVFSSSKYYLNRYDIDKVFETVYGALTRPPRGELLRGLPLPARGARATGHQGLAPLLDVSSPATSATTTSSARCCSPSTSAG